MNAQNKAVVFVLLTIIFGALPAITHTNTYVTVMFVILAILSIAAAGYYLSPKHRGSDKAH